VALVRSLGTTEVASLVHAVMMRAQLRDDHVHMVLLVSSSAYGVTADHGHRRLTGTLVRDDVPPNLADEEPALAGSHSFRRTVATWMDQPAHRSPRSGPSSVTAT
jgi:hypothetical protein